MGLENAAAFCLDPQIICRVAESELETAFVVSITAQKGGDLCMLIPEEIVNVAKEAMLRFGGHPPTLFVQGTKRKVFLRVEFGRDNAERISDMANAGIRLAKSAEVGDVEMVILVCEGWVSPARAEMLCLHRIRIGWRS